MYMSIFRNANKDRVPTENTSNPHGGVKQMGNNMIWKSRDLIVTKACHNTIEKRKYHGYVIVLEYGHMTDNFNK